MSLESLIQKKTDEVGAYFESVFKVFNEETFPMLKNTAYYDIFDFSVRFYTDLYGYFSNPEFTLQEIDDKIKTFQNMIDFIRKGHFSLEDKSFHSRESLETQYDDGYFEDLEECMTIAMGRFQSESEQNGEVDMQGGSFIPFNLINSYQKDQEFYFDRLESHINAKLEEARSALLRRRHSYRKSRIMAEDTADFTRTEADYTFSEEILKDAEKLESEFEERLLLANIGEKARWAFFLSTVLEKHYFQDVIDYSMYRLYEISGEHNIFEMSVEDALEISEFFYIDIPGFELVRKIGQGAFKQVYLGEADNPKGLSRAIKRIDIDSEWESRILEHYKSIQEWQDAEMFVTPLSRVNSPFVSKVEPSVRDKNENWYLVEEAFEETLEDVLQREGKLDVERALILGIQIAEGLRACHEVGVVHRDLKPSNIGLDKNGYVKLTDFGSLESMSFGTKKGDLVNISYSPSDVLSGEKVNPQANIYSAAMILHKMLTGELPFEPTTPKTNRDLYQKEYQENVSILKDLARKERSEYFLNGFDLGRETTPHLTDYFKSIFLGALTPTLKECIYPDMEQFSIDLAGVISYIKGFTVPHTIEGYNEMKSIYDHSCDDFIIGMFKAYDKERRSDPFVALYRHRGVIDDKSFAQLEEGLKVQYEKRVEE